MLVTNAPYQQFFDTDGSPLDEGYVYFGVANQNPETAPVPIYWDEAGTLAATQPVRTLNGFIMRNGTPANVFAPDDCSITVKSKLGVLIVYRGQMVSPTFLSAINAAIAAQFPIPNANLADMVQATIKGRESGSGTGEPVDLTAAQARAILNGVAWDLTAGTANITKTVTGASSPAPTLNLTITDDLAVPANGFFLGAAFLINRTGGTGNREAATARITSNAGPAGEFAVGFHGLARIQTGSGNAAGLNGYAWVDSAADATAEAVGAETNTDVRRAVVRKVGLQVVDVATSGAGGTAFDAGIIIGQQAGALGYNVGLQFGFDGTTGFGVQAGGTLLFAKSTAISFRAGIDFEGIQTFSGAPIILRPGMKGIYWGSTKTGGGIVSETSTAAGDIAFLNAETVVRFGATTGASFRADDTYLMLRTATTPIFRRLIAQAVDTATAGYRNLAVEN